MGVCRGHQIIHVYHGKKVDNCSNGYGVQTFTLIKNEQTGLLASLFRQTVVGQAMHHQGVSLHDAQNGTGDLEPLTHIGQIVKAAESKYGAAAPVICTQFHPEMYSREHPGAGRLHDTVLAKKNRIRFAGGSPSAARYAG